ncbi:recombinase family protein [Salinibacterium sp. G-O1]|uniref:recombinase family protein n=1 Tax=Salinibacterium sp. G-O1 TaxID=3046208 RepID=UPI0024B96873|nr:recombinase family protein [Salinibacterium sp. G-O1]MDJ0335359.1 recombinase family protein [Salinibacterium sp. G-O1]
MNAVMYLRVSSVGQLDGFGLDVQEEACRAYANAHGLHITATFRDEGVSGMLDATEREGLMDALTALQDGSVDLLLVARLDRLARSLTVQEAVLAQVWTANRTLHSADVGEVLRDDPDDPLRTAMRQMAGVFAELDRGMVVKRMRDGRRAKAAQGGRAVGPAPYGYLAKDGMLHLVHAEQLALARMHELRLTGCTMAEIAVTLAEENHPTKRGGGWSSPVVSRILSRPPVPLVQIADVDLSEAITPTNLTKEPAAHAA